MTFRPSVCIVAAFCLASLSSIASAQCDEDKLFPSDLPLTGHFGFAVDVEGDTAISTALDATGAAQDSGAAYVFQRTGSTWIEVQRLAPPDGDWQDRFGSDVAISGDTAIIGAYNDDDHGTFAGSAYVFQRVGGVWSQVQKLYASDSTAHQHFGWHVKIDGDTLAVSAIDPNLSPSLAGSVYVFERVGGVWSETAKLQSGQPASEDFGRGLALGGDTIIVGASYATYVPPTYFAGKVYFFQRSGGVWSLVQEAFAGDPGYFNVFGSSVAISGNHALIGAVGDDESGPNTGSVYVFERSGGVWAQVDKLIASDHAEESGYGMSVDIEGDRAIVGAHMADGAGTDAGAAYLLARTSSGWSEIQRLLPSDHPTGAWFGVSVALSGNTVWAGAQRDGTYGLQSGAAYALELGGDVVNYCSTSPNSAGAGATIASLGSTGLAANDFTLSVSGAPPGKLGLFWYGPNYAQAPFGNGLRCIGGGSHRLNPSQVIDAQGTAQRLVDFTQPPASTGAGQITPGSTWYFQFWYRDPPAGGASFNLSDGLRASFCP